MQRPSTLLAHEMMPDRRRLLADRAFGWSYAQGRKAGSRGLALPQFRVRRVDGTVRGAVRGSWRWWTVCPAFMGRQSSRSYCGGERGTLRPHHTSSRNASTRLEALAVSDMAVGACRNTSASSSTVDDRPWCNRSVECRRDSHPAQ